MPRTLKITRALALLALTTCMLVGAQAGDPVGAVVQSMEKAPPEAQLRILKILMNDVFGTREEVLARFVEACNTRNKPPARAQAIDQQFAGASKAAVMLALCAAPLRGKIEANLAPKPAKGVTDIPAADGKAHP